MQLDDCLLIHAVILPEYGASDIEQEIEQMFLANSYIQEFYRRLRDGSLNKGFNEEFADVLMQCSIEPYEWLENSQTNARYLLVQGIPYEL